MVQPSAIVAPRPGDMVSFQHAQSCCVNLNTDDGRLIPIAAVITPATLSVISAPMNPPQSAMVRVPQIDFTNLKYVSEMPAEWFHVRGRDVFMAYYTNPSVEVMRIVEAVVFQGSILPLTPPALNSSWTLDFHGPSLKCGSIEGEERRLIEQNIAQWVLERPQNCVWASSYLAWTENSYNETGYLPYIRNNDKGLLRFGRGEIVEASMRLRIALIPQFMSNMLKNPSPACQYMKNTTGSDYLGASAGGHNMTFLECRLFNASYQAAFSFESGSQVVSMDINQKEEVFPAGTSGRSMPGFRQDACLHPSHPDKEGWCESNPETLRRLSYTAIFDAFIRQLLGQLSGDGIAVGGGLATNVLKTSLMYTSELDFLRVMVSGATRTSLQRYIRGRDKPNDPEILELSPPTTNTSLATTLENMFQNITISMMASAALQ
jgi:hypothetical protein